MKKIYIVYKFTNTVTGDFYIGSRKDIKRRCANHKYQSVWIVIPNDQIYQDMKKYGDENFVFKVLAEVEEDKLKETEQQFIETLKPTYNQMNEKDLDIERKKKTNKEYQNQLCSYNGEVLTLASLSMRFRRARMPNPDIEAKKYLIGAINERKYNK